MTKIKKIVTKGFASLAALTMLNVGIAPTAYASDPSWHYDPAHPCAQEGQYDVEMPETWRQGSGQEHNGPNFLNEPYNRRVLHPCDEMFETNEDGSKRRSNFEDAGCGTHTWANLMLKTGMAQKGYAAFDAGHYFSCPEYSCENQDTGETDWEMGGGSDSDASYCFGPSRYNGDNAQNITKIKNFGAPYAWNDINGKNDVKPKEGDNYTGDTRQYPSYLTFKGWVRHEKDNDLENNNNFYFTESKAFSYLSLPEIKSQKLDEYYPTHEQAQKINDIMVQHIADDVNAGYFCSLSVAWRGTNKLGDQITDGAHIMCVDSIDSFYDGSPRLVLLDSGGGFEYFDDLVEYWPSDKYNPDKSVPPIIYSYYRVKAAGITSDKAPHFWDNNSRKKNQRCL